MHMKYAKRQQLIGCYGTILSAQSKELFFFIMFANRLEFVWTWIQRKFIFSKISLYTAPKRLIEKVIPNKNHLSLVFFTELSTSYMQRCLQFYQFCALLWTHSWRNKNCALRPALRERREQDNHRCLLNVKRIYGENFLGGFWWTWSKTSLSSNVNFCWDDKWITSDHKSVRQESRTRDECRGFWFKFKKGECPFEGFVAWEGN